MDKEKTDGKKVVQQREVIYEWKSPMRAFQKLDKKRFWLVSLAVLALFVVLAILGHYFLMIAISAVMFLVYVLGTIPPEKVEHAITSLGVETMGKPYNWEFLKEYWFSERDSQKMLNIDTKIAFPSRLIMLVGDDDMKVIHSALKKRLMYKDLRDQKGFSKVLEGEWINLLEKDSLTNSAQDSVKK